MAHPPKFTPDKRKEFLRLISESGNVSKACIALGIDRRVPYRLRERSKKFAQQWDEAKKMYVELLEEESFRRAYNGIEKSIWYKGEKVGVERQYSDTLLMHRLNAELPNKYQYRHKVDANVEGNITVKVVKFSDGDNDSK